MGINTTMGPRRSPKYCRDVTRRDLLSEKALPREEEASRNFRQASVIRSLERAQLRDTSAEATGQICVIDRRRRRVRRSARLSPAEFPEAEATETEKRVRERRKCERTPLLPRRNVSAIAFDKSHPRRGFW